MTKRMRTGICACLGMFLLILDARTALQGAQEGIDLCISVVVPSLFPFFVLTNLLTGNLIGSSGRFLAHLGRLCRMPQGSESLLITGLLGGYPSGAVCIRQAYETGQLSGADARRLLSFCSNAGPAFVFGILAPKFPDISWAWALWIIHILSAIFVGAVFPGGSCGSVRLTEAQGIGAAEALRRSLRAMASVCGWVVIFRVIIAVLSRWCLWLLPREGQIVVTGLLELTNGCCDLEWIESDGLRFLCAAGSLGFGGLCVAMQTASAVADLGIKTYLQGRVLCGTVSLLLAAVCLGIRSCRLPAAFYLLLPAAAAFILQKKRKNSSNPAAVGV